MAGRYVGGGGGWSDFVCDLLQAMHAFLVTLESGFMKFM